MDDHRRTSSCDGPKHDCQLAREISEDAADNAVKKVFAILGVDIDKPESVEEFREDLRFGKKLRKAADHGQLALFAALFIALGAAAWSGIVQKLTGGH